MTNEMSYKYVIKQGGVQVYSSTTESKEFSYNFPKNTGDTNIVYTIDFEDANGCTATTSVTVPKCETANNDTCRKFSFSLENRRLYLTVDEDTTGELHYAYESLLDSMEGGNITYVFNNSKKSENYLDLSNKDSKWLYIELVKSATDSCEHNFTLEWMRDLTNYYEHYKYWDVIINLLFDLNDGNIFGQNNASVEDISILWAMYCRGIPMTNRARLVETNYDLVCNGDDDYTLYICQGVLPLDRTSRIDFSKLQILKRYGDDFVSLCYGQISYEGLLNNVLENHTCLKNNLDSGEQRCHLYALPTRGQELNENDNFTKPFFWIANDRLWNAVTSNSDVSWQIYSYEEYSKYEHD